jgi:hypothetical protein
MDNVQKHKLVLMYHRHKLLDLIYYPVVYLERQRKTMINLRINGLWAEICA